MDPPSKRPKRKATGLTSTRLFNPDSPITAQDSDIQSFLSICLSNWSQYDEEEKSSIIRALPTSYQKVETDQDGKICCPLIPNIVVDDKVLRDQIARFKRDVKDGFYTKTWQEKARKAMEERANGKFDAYLSKHADEMFVNDDEDERGSSDEDYGVGAKIKKTNKSKSQA